MQNESSADFEDGAFKELAQYLDELMTLADSTDDSDVAIRAYEYIVDVLDTDGYPQKFRDDNVSEDKLLNMIDDIGMALRGKYSDDADAANLWAHLPTVKESVSSAYLSAEEG